MSAHRTPSSRRRNEISRRWRGIHAPSSRCSYEARRVRAGIDLISTQALANEKCRDGRVPSSRSGASRPRPTRRSSRRLRPRPGDPREHWRVPRAATCYNRVHDARLFGIRADGGVIFSLVSLAVTFDVFFWMFGIEHHVDIVKSAN